MVDPVHKIGLGCVFPQSAMSLNISFDNFYDLKCTMLLRNALNLSDLFMIQFPKFNGPFFNTRKNLNLKDASIEGYSDDIIL